MRIGIDMLGVQASLGGERETSRYARQLVVKLLAGEPGHHFIIYVHEGFPTHCVPISRNAQRVTLAAIPGGSTRLRSTTQRLIDQNPDDLDWLLLLDPFDPNYGGVPPEAPLNDLKIASLVLDLAPSLVDDRRLAPLRHHDLILAVSEATATECRRRIGSSSSRVATIDVASEQTLAVDPQSDPLTRVLGEELGRLGITGPFVLAQIVGGAARANLSGIIEAYCRLPVELRRRHQLVIAGVVSDPWSVVAFLHERGCAEGLVLVGEVDESTLRMLYRRCSAFVSPSGDTGCGLTLVEAMLCGAPVVAGFTRSQSEIVGDAGLLVDPDDPESIFESLSAILSDGDFEHQLRVRAYARGARFGWDSVVAEVLAAFQSEPSTELAGRRRIDSGHVARPRIAILFEFGPDETNPIDVARQVALPWSESYCIDFYFKSDQSALADSLPTEFGGFDARQFDRNDGLLGYHAVVYRLGVFEQFDDLFGRMRTRPGLVILGDESCLDRPSEALEDGSRSLALARLRDLFGTASRLGMREREALERIARVLPEHESQVFAIPTEASNAPALARILTAEVERCATELPRGPGRRSRKTDRNSLDPGSTPHSSRSSSITDEVASRSR